MEGLPSTFPPFNVSGTPVCAPPPQGGSGSSSWGKREVRFMTPHGLNYLELCKAILCQVDPGLQPPPPRKTNTRECGVQVNARVDKIVQCSLGPKTLLGQESSTPESPEPYGHGGKSTTTATTPSRVSHLRFLRPVSIYSPVFDRRALVRRQEDGGSEGEGAEEGGAESDKDADADDCSDDLNTSLDQSSKDPKGFQFLEQRYGFFHCKKCNIRWESAYVWCISGTSKVYYKQLCRKCQVGFNPYRVEAILCKGCSQTSCSCERKQRHINMKRPHRQDLCCRCKGMKLSCDATYSFKYIV